MCVLVVCVSVSAIVQNQKTNTNTNTSYECFVARLELRIQTPIPTEKGEWYTIDLSVCLCATPKNTMTNVIKRQTHKCPNTLTHIQTKQMK